MEILPLPDRQLAGGPQRHRHARGGLHVPPSAPRRALTLEVCRLEWSLVAKPLPERARECLVLGEHVAPPRVDGKLLPPELEEREQLERHPAHLVAPVLKERFTGTEQVLRVTRVESVETRVQHDPV